MFVILGGKAVRDRRKQASVTKSKRLVGAVNKRGYAECRGGMGQRSHGGRRVGPFAFPQQAYQFHATQIELETCESQKRQGHVSAWRSKHGASMPEVNQ
jgi:hypothetical protein